MAIPWYPTELPVPVRGDYSLSSGDGRTLFQTSAGLSLVRLRSSATADAISFSTILTRWQLERFRRFYRTEAKKGGQPFWLYDPLTDGFPMLTEDLVPVLADDGAPLLLAEVWLTRFGKNLPVERTMSPQIHQVTFELERLPL